MFLARTNINYAPLSTLPLFTIVCYKQKHTFKLPLLQLFVDYLGNRTGFVSLSCGTATLHVFLSKFYKRLRELVFGTSLKLAVVSNNAASAVHLHNEVIFSSYHR